MCTHANRHPMQPRRPPAAQRVNERTQDEVACLDNAHKSSICLQYESGTHRNTFGTGITSTYKLANKPTVVCFVLSMLRNRSGFHSSASGPQISGKLRVQPNIRVECLVLSLNKQHLCLPIICANEDVDGSALPDWDGRDLLSRPRGDGEGQWNHVVPSRCSAQYPDDGVQPHRLLRGVLKTRSCVA